MEQPPCHDPCAVAYVIDPTKFCVSKMRVDIETQSDLAAGQTICDTYGMSKLAANVNVATSVDVDWVWTVVVDALAAASVNKK